MDSSEASDSDLDPKTQGARGAISDSDDDGGGVFSGLGFGGGRKRRKGGDDNVLGVFADDDGVKEDKPRGKGRQKGGAGRPRASSLMGVQFVKGESIKTSSSHKVSSRKRTSDNSDEEIDPRFRLDDPETGVVGAGVQHGPKLQARNKMTQNQMSSSYGKGFAMLKKMGWKQGGLGRHEDGIANPIEVLKREGKLGIQDDGEIVNQDLYGTEYVASKASLEELLSPLRPSDGPRAHEGWKKGVKPKKQKVVYKTAAELASEKPAQGMRIIDMRFPEVKIASSFDELRDRSASENVCSLKEMRYNTRMLVSKFEDKLGHINEKKRYYQDLLIQATKDVQQLEAACSLSDKEVQNCRDLVGKIEDLRVKQDEGELGLAELAAALAKMRRESGKEFMALKGDSVALSFAVPVARKELATWNPLEKPADASRILKPWKLIDPVGSSTVITALCENVLLPKLRTCLSPWDVRDFEKCIKLYECCRDALPSSEVQTLATDAILPRLRVEVEAWNPRTDKMPVHLWIHPWLPLLGQHMDCLWAPLRFKLSRCMDIWNPSDRSAVAVLEPWRQVFDVGNWEPLAEKVLLKLADTISGMPVSRGGKDLKLVEDILAWKDVMPLAGLARVLERSFFPQWIEALRCWLISTDCDFTEVLKWYHGWQAVFPQELLEEPRLQKFLAHGLDLMKQRMSGGDLEELASSDEEEEEAPAGSAQPQEEAAPQVDEVNLTLPEYLADVAGDLGMVFKPKQNRHNGKQVYQLGSVSVYLERNLVFVAPKSGGGEWKCVNHDELLRLAQLAPAKR